MKRMKPPVFAVWMLEHLVPGEKNRALAGDLLEEFSQGRSTLWYCRQVLMAIILGSSKELGKRWSAVAFAVFWSIPIPAFWALVVIRAETSTFVTREWHLPWPYSMVCDLSFSNACQIIYIWSGLGAYCLLSYATGGNISLRSLRRGMMIGVLAAIAVFSGWLAINSVFTFTQDSVDVRHMPVLRLFIDPRLIAFRVPFFLTLLAPFLALRPRNEDRTSSLAQ